MNWTQDEAVGRLHELAEEAVALGRLISPTAANVTVGTGIASPMSLAGFLVAVAERLDNAVLTLERRAE
jgi:hypothetical protein